MAGFSYGSAPPRIGKIAPGKGLIRKEIGKTPPQSVKPTMRTARMPKPRGR